MTRSSVTMAAGGTDSASSTKSPCRYVTRLPWPRPDPRPRPLLPIPAQIGTLIHHTIHGLGVGYAEYGRERAEVIVDTATHLVCASVGLRVDGESVPYVAGWGEDGAIEAVAEFAKTIDELATADRGRPGRRRWQRAGCGPVSAVTRAGVRGAARRRRARARS